MKRNLVIAIIGLVGMFVCGGCAGVCLAHIGEAVVPWIVGALVIMGALFADCAIRALVGYWVTKKNAVA